MRLIDSDELCEGRVENDPVRIAAMCAPTIEAITVVHGEWKSYKKQGIAVCTNCSFERKLDDDFGRAISCPNCGADMRKKV
ncbi:MAG: hypothetical protein IKZ00_08075 [Bacteroidaceae bacterium]|nr:hypothetical protein [Bacteroidaceae bacterium]